MHNKKTLVLGATTKPGRYALMAAERLLQKGHSIELFGQSEGEVGGVNIKTKIEEIDKEVLEWEWNNKMLKHTGLQMDEQSRIGYFLHHFNNKTQIKT